MLELNISSKSLKKDIKRVKSQGKPFELLDEILDILLTEKKIPSQYKPHKLTGNYQGYWELHIQPDWLLIYKIIGNCLYLVRMGSHSDLFK